MDEFENNQSVDIAETEEDKTPNTEDEAIERIKRGSVAGATLGGILGAFVALIIIAVCVGITGGMRYFPYLLIPLCIGFAVVLLKGNKGVPGYILTVIFTAFGVYLAPAFGAATDYVLKQGISVFTIPLVAFTKVGDSAFLSGISFSSAYVFPIVFAIIGLGAVWQLFKYCRTR